MRIDNNNIEHINTIKRLSKKKGQNFLVNITKAITIVEALCINDYDIIYEVGPGLGALSDIIVFNFKFTIFNMIEIDYDLYNILYNKYKQYFKNKNIILKNCNIFDSDIWYTDKNIKIISNLPFSIQKNFISKIICLRVHIDTMILMMQYEFEKIINLRISAFGALISTVFNVYNVCYVNNTDFVPVPKVRAVVLKFKYKSNIYNIDYYKYYDFLHMLYSNKRKILRNNEKVRVHTDFHYRRAHELNIDELVKCYLHYESTQCVK